MFNSVNCTGCQQGVNRVLAELKHGLNRALTGRSHGVNMVL